MKAFLPALGFLVQLAGCQLALRADEGRRLALALALMQAGWMLAGALSFSEAGSLGAWAFLMATPLHLAPLTALAWNGLGSRWLLLGLLLAFAGCLPFANFPAYFHAFIPMMSVGEGVGSMQGKLFSAAGLLATLATLSVVYQTGSLGYFYWSKVLQAPPSAPAAGWARIWAAWALAQSAWIGLHAKAWMGWIRQLFLS